MINTSSTKFRMYYGLSATNTTPSMQFKGWRSGSLPISGKAVTKSVENSHGFKYTFFRVEFRIYWSDSKTVGIETIKTLNITDFEVTYENCPALIRNLVRYNNSVAARQLYVPIRSTGVCVTNAEKVENRKDRDLQRYCDHKANAQFVEECLCKAGFEPINNLTECKGRFIVCHCRRRREKQCNSFVEMSTPLCPF